MQRKRSPEPIIGPVRLEGAGLNPLIFFCLLRPYNYWKNDLFRGIYK